MMDRGTAKNKPARSAGEKSRPMSAFSHLSQWEWLPFLVLFIAMLFLHSRISMDSSDDAWFLRFSKEFSLPDYIRWRYSWWSGRVSVESVLYLIFKDGGRLWRILNPLFIVLFAYGVSRITLGRNEMRKEHRHAMNWFIVLGWLYMNRSLLAESMFWMTGSINYIWTVAAGLVALVPFRDAVAGDFKFTWHKVLYLLPAGFAGMGQEQIAIIMAVFAVIINIQLFLVERKVNLFLVLETLLILGSFLVLYGAPGNVLRIQAETNSWMPNYPLYSTMEFIFNGFRWLLDSIVNDSRLIFFLMATALAVAVFRKYKGIQSGFFTLIPFLAIGLLLLGFIFLVYVRLPGFIASRVTFPPWYLSLSSRVQHYLFNFNTDFKLFSFRTIKLMGWPVLLSLIPFYLYTLFGFTLKSLYSILIYLAGMCASIVMFISPTIHASGYRTIFVMNVALFLLFILLIRNMEWLFRKRYILLFSIFPIVRFILLYRAFFAGLLWHQL